MSTFDEREKSFENKYKRDQELQFKVMARRAKLLGHWAAELMGLKGAAAESYAKQVVVSDFDVPGDQDLFDKVQADLKAHNIAIPEHRLRKQMDELLETAKQEIAKSG
jgi:hypothetical protein